MANILNKFAAWLYRKTAPQGVTGAQWTGTGYIDSFKRNRQPTPNELMAELKATAWTCATINSAVCAAYPPHLYVVTAENAPPPKCRVKSIGGKLEKKLRQQSHLFIHTKAATKIQEVVDHPVLTLMDQVNPVHNAFDLWELTTLYQEVHGSAYWYLEHGPLGIPKNIWIMPTQNMTPCRDPKSPNIVDYYEYRTGSHRQTFHTWEIIHFRYPNPRDPYSSGLSPLMACFEQCSIASDYAAFRSAKLQNRAIPDAIISPDEVIGEEERDRVETQWNTKFRRGGAGRILVAESPMKVQLLTQSMGDLAALADIKATKEDIANAFHVPLSMLSPNTNLANVQASEHQHMTKCISPRLQRRDEKLNEQLIPIYDPSRRLFLASEDPTPINSDLTAKEKEINIKYGIISINENRIDDGLDPVPWGWAPWMPAAWEQKANSKQAEDALDGEQA